MLSDVAFGDELHAGRVIIDPPSTPTSLKLAICGAGGTSTEPLPHWGLAACGSSVPEVRSDPAAIHKPGGQPAAEPIVFLGTHRPQPGSVPGQRSVQQPQLIQAVGNLRNQQLVSHVAD